MIRPLSSSDRQRLGEKIDELLESDNCQSYGIKSLGVITYCRDGSHGLIHYRHRKLHIFFAWGVAGALLALSLLTTVLVLNSWLFHEGELPGEASLFKLWIVCCCLYAATFLSLLWPFFLLKPRSILVDKECGRLYWVQSCLSSGSISTYFPIVLEWHFHHPSRWSDEPGRPRGWWGEEWMAFRLLIRLPSGTKSVGLGTLWSWDRAENKFSEVTALREDLADLLGVPYQERI